MPRTLSKAALSVLQTANAREKAELTRKLISAWRSGEITEIGQEELPNRPARPDKPELRMPRDMPRRAKAGSSRAKIALLHALAHIELNAIDLAWDVMARFAHYSQDNQNCHSETSQDVEESQSCKGDPSATGASAPFAQDDSKPFALPKAFYDDWCKVADDEAKHLLMLEDRLNDLDASYGDLPAHDGLWEASEATAHDFAARLAIVPMVLEARGLDVTPGMIAVMQKQGDEKTAEMLQIIHDDEITHVKAGSDWFKTWCAYHDKKDDEYWQELVQTYFSGKLKRPFNHPSREKSGMLRHWYEPLADEEPKEKSA